jgi:hypothetical protein
MALLGYVLIGLVAQLYKNFAPGSTPAAVKSA